MGYQPIEKLTAAKVRQKAALHPYNEQVAKRIYKRIYDKAESGGFKIICLDIPPQLIIELRESGYFVFEGLFWFTVEW